MTATVTPRRSMRDRVKIGQAWQRNRDKQIAVIRMIHRADRQVELLGIDGVRLVSFNDLRTKWTEQPPRPSGEPLDTPAAPVATAAGHGATGAAGTPLPRPPTRRNFERIPGRSDLEFMAAHPIDKENAVPLPTTKTSRAGRDPRDARILLAGPPKVGKTTLSAAWAPDTTLILDTHQGTTLLDGDHYIQPVHDFGAFETTVNELAAGGHQYRTIVIDLIEDIYKQADRLAAQRHNQLAAGLVEFGKGTAEAEALFRRAIDKLLATRLGVWMICHTETIQDGNINQFVPRLDKRVRTYIEGACDFVLLADARGPKRQLHTGPSARFQAGTRTPLPDPMDLDARALYVEIAKGLTVPKPAAAPAAAPSAPVQTEPEKVAA